MASGGMDGIVVIPESPGLHPAALPPEEDDDEYGHSHATNAMQHRHRTHHHQSINATRHGQRQDIRRPPPHPNTHHQPQSQQTHTTTTEPPAAAAEQDQDMVMTTKPKNNDHNVAVPPSANVIHHASTAATTAPSMTTTMNTNTTPPSNVLTRTVLPKPEHATAAPVVTPESPLPLQRRETPSKLVLGRTAMSHALQPTSQGTSAAVAPAAAATTAQSSNTKKKHKTKWMRHTTQPQRTPQAAKQTAQRRRRLEEDRAGADLEQDAEAEAAQLFGELTPTPRRPLVSVVSSATPARLFQVARDGGDSDRTTTATLDSPKKEDTLSRAAAAAAAATTATPSTPTAPNISAAAAVSPAPSSPRPRGLSESALVRAAERDAARRRDTLDMAQHAVQQAVATEENHWIRQDKRFALLMQRLIVAKHTCAELHAYLKRSNESHALVASEALKMGIFGTHERGTVRQCAIAHEVLAKTTAQYVSEMRDRVFAESVHRVVLLTKQVDKRYRAAHARGLGLSKEVCAARQKVDAAWETYRRCAETGGGSSKRDLGATASGNEVGARMDPFMACRNYETELQHLQDVERQYGREMTKLLESVKEDDARRIDALQQIMMDHLLAQKAVLEHTVKFTDSAIKSVAEVNREKDVQEWIDRSGLLVPVSQTEAVNGGAVSGKKKSGSKKGSMTMSTVFQIPAPLRDTSMIVRLYSEELAKEGPVSRQGRFFRRSWKPAYVVVSRSGFFHLFESKDSAVPTWTVQLKHDIKVNVATAVDPLAVEIVCPSTSYFSLTGSSTSYLFKAESEEDLKEWYHVLEMMVVAASGKP